MMENPRHQLGRYIEYQPNRPWMECFWLYLTHLDQPVVPHCLVPDPTVSLSFTCMRDSQGEVHSPCLELIGPIQACRVFQPEPGYEMASIKIKVEYLASLFGLKSSDFIDQRVDMAEINPRLTDQVLNGIACTKSTFEALEMLVSTVDRLNQPEANGASDAMDLIRQHRGQRSVEQIAKTLGVATRSLNRVVKSITGCSPKTYARLLRFHHVLELSDQLNHPNWSDLALGCGFYDQAHMIRDFQFFTRHSPRRLHHQREFESDFSNFCLS